MDAQRNSYDTMTLADETGVPDMSTDLLIERHASKVYTNKIFYEVQIEIVASVMKCVMSRMYMEGDLKMYDVDDGTGAIFNVTRCDVENNLSCTCKLFVRKGLLCRHVLYVMHNMKLKKIPEKYILKRWSKLSRSSLYTDGSVANEKVVDKTLVGNQRFFTELCKSVSSVNNNVELQERLLLDLEEISEKYAKLGVSPDLAGTKQSLFEQFYGRKIPDQIDVESPDVAVTKGSGVGGRRKSEKEKAIEASKKNLRNCRGCNRLVPHDSRNCPSKKTIVE